MEQLLRRGPAGRLWRRCAPPGPPESRGKTEQGACRSAGGNGAVRRRRAGGTFPVKRSGVARRPPGRGIGGARPRQRGRRWASRGLAASRREPLSAPSPPGRHPEDRRRGNPASPRRAPDWPPGRSRLAPPAPWLLLRRAPPDSLRAGRRGRGALEPVPSRLRPRCLRGGEGRPSRPRSHDRLRRAGSGFDRPGRGPARRPDRGGRPPGDPGRFP